MGIARPNHHPMWLSPLPLWAKVVPWIYLDQNISDNGLWGQAYIFKISLRQENNNPSSKGAEKIHLKTLAYHTSA